MRRYHHCRLQRELESTNAEALEPEALRNLYIRIVEDVTREFLAGVQRNIRNRVFANPLANLRAMLPGSYNRSVRLGELLESELFGKAIGKAAGKIWLNDLTIQLPGEASPFNPVTGNWQRRAKVPILVLNATTLNTGHNWQYTATWMGELPHAIDPELDGNNRLRRMWYDRDAPPNWKRVRLGHAAVASACVPGLFEPVQLTRGLRPSRWRADRRALACTARGRGCPR